MRRFSWGIGFLALLGCGDGSSVAPMAAATPTAVEGPGQPSIEGPVVVAAKAPPPISGGTLLVLRDRKTAIVADPDRDQLFVVDTAALTIQRTVTLEAGSEPGRAAEDTAGRVHVVLRGKGQLLTFDPAGGGVQASRAVCAYPRGVAVDDGEQLVHVACAEGNLVSLSTDASRPEPVRNIRLDRDLRDVVVAADGVWLSRFRSAEILRVDASGKLLTRTLLPKLSSGVGESLPSVAWRMVPNAAGGVVIVHQRAFVGEVSADSGGYGETGVAGGIVGTAITTVSERGETTTTSAVLSAPLPVDIAQSSVSGRLLLASAALDHPTAGSPFMRTLLVRPSDLTFAKPPSSGGSVPGVILPAIVDGQAATAIRPGQLVAVAFAGDIPVLQYREPSLLVVGGRGLSLPGESVADTGSTLFHLETSSGLACASCHPEGHEDGHVWNFAGFGARRTQSLRGGLLGTEPFHWDGLEADFSMLTGDVMQGRMGGPELTPEQNQALATYLDKLPAMRAPSVASTPSIERGKALFDDPAGGCITCHSGARFSNNETMDVGVGQHLQVPGLVGLWARAPYLHDGCAKTLADRFTVCDKGSHGNSKQLSSSDILALTDYLETL